MFSECGTIHQPPAFVLVISLFGSGQGELKRGAARLVRFGP
jgi:hypothetical protein